MTTCDKGGRGQKIIKFLWWKFRRKIPDMLWDLTVSGGQMPILQWLDNSSFLNSCMWTSNLRWAVISRIKILIVSICFYTIRAIKIPKKNISLSVKASQPTIDHVHLCGRRNVCSARRAPDLTGFPEYLTLYLDIHYVQGYQRILKIKN